MEPLEQLIPRCSAPLMAEVRALLNTHQLPNKIKAILLVRHQSGMALHWCRDFVMAWDRNDMRTVAALSTRAWPPAVIELEIRALLVCGLRREAIDRACKYTDWCITTAELYVDALLHKTDD